MRMVLLARQSPIQAQHRLVNDKCAAKQVTRAGRSALHPVGFYPPCVREAGCFIVLLIVTAVAIALTAQAAALRTSGTDTPASVTELPAQTAPAPPSSGKTPAAGPKITYIGGQLRISVLDSTLADVLTQVAALTGVKLDVPAGASNERMPVVELGPGPARQVLASLLSESSFDYVIQSSATDPEKMQSVLLMPRETKGSKANGVDLAASRPIRSPYSRAAAAAAEAVETPVPESPVPAQPESASPDPNASNPPPAPTQSDTSTPLPSTQPGQSNFSRAGALTPPATLSPQSMSQQLQQMYQQRMQMVQQERQLGQPATPANPGNN